MAFVLEGHRTSTAASADEAIALVSKYRFDAVLLDLQLPDVNGWQLLELIRQLPLGEQVPVILFSAHHDLDKEERAREVGAYALLRKPMLPQYVLAMIESAVSERLS